ncbi:MAG: heme ABC transporter ATP-binding protein [Acidimicrobiales bacterium]|nr:heme ABC transporter ATP-binding protein [Acidimicrobiales bacterium]
MSGTLALEARQVTYRAGAATLLDGVSLPIRHGEVVALVGPNGAGKTTLVRVLAGDVRPTDGRVFVEGTDLRDWKPKALAQRRAVLPQHSALELGFTAREVVALGRTPWNGTDAEQFNDQVIDDALAATGTASLAERTVLTLSGGEASRVHLARVLAQATPVLLLDEPTAALDLRHQSVVLEAASAITGEGGSVVAVLHDLNLAAAFADRVAVLRAGRIEAFGPPQDVLQSDLLSDVYGTPVVVIDHPTAGHPVVLSATARRRPTPAITPPVAPHGDVARRSQPPGDSSHGVPPR